MAVTRRATASALAIALAALSIGLLLTRGGLLAGLGLGFAIAMLVKAWKRPRDGDVKWIAGGVAAWCALWGITLGLGLSRLGERGGRRDSPRGSGDG